MNTDLLNYTTFITSLQVMQQRPLFILHHESVTTMVIHRDRQFQTELVIGHPKAIKWDGEHRHPNVDSVEIALFNCINFTRNKLIVAVPDLVINGMACVNLKPTDWHGVPYMEEGFSLLSVQMWLNNTIPSSVGLDWEGKPTSQGHAQQLKL